MKEIALSVAGTRYKAKKLEDGFADFLAENLKESGLTLEGDNSVERLFIAYLRLAGKSFKTEEEIEEMLRRIESGED